jgi:hypothetical protein
MMEKLLLKNSLPYTREDVWIDNYHRGIIWIVLKTAFHALWEKLSCEIIEIITIEE